MISNQYHNLPKKYIFKIVIVALAIIGISFSCSLPDDYEGEYYDFTIDNLIVVENEDRLLTVNDTLWITTSLPTSFQENGSTIATDSRMASGDLMLQQLTDFDNPTSITLSEDELLVDIGFTSSSSDRIYVQAERLDGELVNRFGIILKSPGVFILSSGTDFGIRFYYERDLQTDISLSTTIRNANDTFKYEFVVEE